MKEIKRNVDSYPIVQRCIVEWEIGKSTVLTPVMFTYLANLQVKATKQLPHYPRIELFMTIRIQNKEMLN